MLSVTGHNVLKILFIVSFFRGAISVSFIYVNYLCYEFLFIVTGLVPFAIGSETAGSITYPAARCGVTALRPTFGTVGRTGVMSISESLVKPKLYVLLL